MCIRDSIKAIVNLSAGKPFKGLSLGQTLEVINENLAFLVKGQQLTVKKLSLIHICVESATASLHRLIDTLEVNRIDELRTIKENQEEHREQMKAAFREIEETMNTMAKMPPITINVDFGSTKGHVAAGEPEEGKPQDRDCWSCRTCGNTKPISMDVEKCRECEDGSQYTEADTPDEKSHEMESEEPDNGNE